MRTKLCRPILINSKETSNIGDICVFPDGIEIAHFRAYSYPKKELILISLIDDDIKDGEICCYSNSFGATFLVKAVKTEFGIVYQRVGVNPIDEYGSETGGITPLDNEIFKIIATQEQLSPEYIQQFIEEYNEERIKDIEIEMDCYKQIVNCIDRKTPNCTEYKDVEYDLICKPKLTNGFITIINKKRSCFYTEAEVRSIATLAFKAGHERGYSGYPNTDNWTKPKFEEWFENNKKK